MKNITLAYVDFKFDVVQARGNTGSFRIHMHIKRRVKGIHPSTIIVHEGLFATREDAVRMCNRIKARGKIKLAHWIWSQDADASFQCFHVKPTARYKTKPVKVGI